MPSIETSSTNNSSVTPESSSMPRSSAISALRDAVSAWDLSARVSCCMEILLRWGCDGTRARLDRWSLMLVTVWRGAEPVTMLPAVIAPSGWTGTRARGTLAARAGRPQARRYGLRPGRCGLIARWRAHLSWRLWPGPAGRGATRSIGQVTSPAGPGRMRSLSGGIGARVPDRSAAAQPRHKGASADRYGMPTQRVDRAAAHATCRAGLGSAVQDWPAQRERLAAGGHRQRAEEKGHA